MSLGRVVPAVAVAALLAGCSSPTTTSTTTSPDTPSAAEPAPTPAPEPAAPAAEPAAAPAETAASTPAASAPVATSAQVPDLVSDDDKTVYALGLVLAQNLQSFDLSPKEVEIFKRAISDANAKKPALKLEDWGPKIDPFNKSRTQRGATKNKQAGTMYELKAASQPGATRTATGLIFKDIKAGTGASPTATDRVRVNYRGTLIDGTEFDSSYKRNQPAEFALNQVIPCWTEGVQKIKVGGKAQLVCPEDIAYGPNARPNIPANSTLVFEVELLDILK